MASQKINLNRQQPYLSTSVKFPAYKISQEAIKRKLRKEWVKKVINQITLSTRDCHGIGMPCSPKAEAVKVAMATRHATEVI